MSQFGNETEASEPEDGSLFVPKPQSLNFVNSNAAQSQAGGKGKEKRSIEEIEDAESPSKPPKKKVAVEGARGFLPKPASKDAATKPKVPYDTLEDASQLPAWASGSNDLKKILKFAKVRD